MKVIFVDTNYFLQFRDGRELPWSDIFGEEEIILLVPRTVQKEIDRLKHDGNSRRAGRARATATLFRDIIRASDQTITLRESAPRVTLRFSPHPDPNRTKTAGLDLTIDDDCIVEETLAYSQANLSESVCLLTEDTGLLRTAQEHGLDCIPAPDGWMLPPEPDKRDRLIQDLMRQVDTLEKAFPIVTIVSSNSASGDISALMLDLPMFSALTESCLADLLTEVAQRCPPEGAESPLEWEAIMRKTALAASGGRYYPPTEDEVRKYSESDYPAWLEAVKSALIELPQRLNRQQRRLQLVFSVSNSGVVPAKNAILEIEACAGVLLGSPTDEEHSSGGQPVWIPQPPRPPQGRWGNTYGSSALAIAASFGRQAPTSLWVPEFNRPQRRDRNAFYWKAKQAKPTAYLALECEEFRHQQPPEEFRIVVVIPERGGESSNIVCKVSASNLPKPTVFNVPVRVEYRQTDPEPEARRLISELRRTPVRGTISIDGVACDL